ncbi:uncharacterized protein LOC107627528 [Arachis ipaensis]|uniref:uncharacterized protein LOC107627528 n=1 Tax=Arachis ipaensis TaxID=130454 RepID=UPI0007AF4AE3|nr:uncharacterized protein LOC107627528 [Arachis ipaensis]
MVKNEWRNLGDAQFMWKLKALTGPLRQWHNNTFRDMDKRLGMFEEEIARLDNLVSNGIYDGTTEARGKALVCFCEKWYARKEMHWKQMSRSQHAADMDKNTRYFHTIASARRRSNRIEALMINGRLVRNQARIKGAIRGFYKELYRQEYAPRIGFKDGLVKQISGEEAVALEVMPSEEEIKEAVWDCESSKAPGSDGYNMNFIKKCWDDIGPDFIAAVLGFFRSAQLPTEANVTWVTLAPKVEGAKEVKDFRPISMVGCLYKVISKVLVRRMRPVMLGLVGETQTAFVKGRKIHDGALIACETVHWLKARKKEAVIIKLDFQKAYDRVRWSFVDIVLQKMETETIVNYKRLLRCFELMSGLSINFEKSNLIPVNCEQEWIERACDLLGCQKKELPVRYLGISLGANPQLVKTWKPIIDKVEQKLSLWKAKVLNKAGKLVLIKSVLNSLPIYYLSLYKMPRAVASKLIALQRHFMWCKEDGTYGIPLVKWELVQAPKKAGGLGVGDVALRNTALFFKWWWRFSKEEFPLWKKIVCSCNKLSPNLMLAKQSLPVKGGPWKDICQLNIKEQRVRDKIVNGLAMEVDNGRKTRFWEANWVQGGPLRVNFPRLFSVSSQQNFVIGDCGFWDGLEWI